MTQFLPFRALHFNPALFHDLSPLITAPAFSMCGDFHQRVYEEHPYNFARICWGKPLEQDTSIDNPAVRARQYLDNWKSHKFITRQEKPAFYLYVQRFIMMDQPYVRYSLFGLAELDKISNQRVFSKEEELNDKDIASYQELLKRMQGNPEPISVIYKNQGQDLLPLFEQIFADPSKALFTARDYDAAYSWIFLIDDPAHIEQIQSVMNDQAFALSQPSVAAVAAGKYAQVDSGAGLAMVSAVNICQPGFALYPFHRCLSKEFDFDFQKLRPDFEAFFDIQEIDDPGKTGDDFDTVLWKDKCYGLTCKSPVEGNRFFAVEEIILKRILKLSDQDLTQALMYEFPFEKVKFFKSQFAACFLMPRPVSEHLNANEETPYPVGSMVPRTFSGLIFSQHFSKK